MDKIFPGRVTNASVAYYHLPPVWVGNDPFKEGANPSRHSLSEVVLTKTLPSRISVRVCRDGLFIFNFSDWGSGAPITIPEWKSSPGEKVPKKVQDAERKAEEHVYRRVEAMNAHLACLNSAISMCQLAGVRIGQVVSPSDVLNLHWRSSGRWEFGLNPYGSPMHAYVTFQRNLLAEGSRQSRRSLVLSMETIEKSFETFEALVSSNVSDCLTMSAILLQSVKTYGAHDFSTSLTMSWTVLEKLVSAIWKKMIEDNKSRVEEGATISFIGGDRRKKLQGRDYTASVRLEILSLLGHISTKMYDDLNKVRTSRNDWLHNFEQVDENLAALAIQTAQRLFEQVAKIKLSLTISRSISY